MAAALAVDVPTARYSSVHSFDSYPAATMAPGEDHVDKFPSSRRKPPPVTTSPLNAEASSAASGMVTTTQSAGSSLSPQLSPRLTRHTPPDFVFPAKPPTSAPSSYSRATGRRPKSVADLDRGLNVAFSFPASPAPGGPNVSPRSPGAADLPAFNFRPGAGLPSTPNNDFLSPPQSPMPPRAIPARPGGGGHRRGGSELVGGSMRGGESLSYLSTSPTKSEGGLSSPRMSPINGSSNSLPGPSDRPRRGHANRRSAAMSMQDVSFMKSRSGFNPAVPPFPHAAGRGNSVPSSPKGLDKGYTFPDRSATDPNLQSYMSSEPEAEAAPVEKSHTTVDPEAPVVKEAPAPETNVGETAKPPLRTRVGFSDTLEFIPRPLSVVSSDSASTITGRPATSGGGHSVNGSISSIISLNASIAASIDLDRELESPSPIVRSTSRGSANESRPSTAGAILDRTQSFTMDDVADANVRRRNSIPVLSTIPSPGVSAESQLPAAAQALASPNKTPKRWSFFSLDPFIGGSGSHNNSPTRTSNSTSPVMADNQFPPPSATDSSKMASPTGSPLTQAPAQIPETRGYYDIDETDDNELTRTVSRRSSSKKKKKVKTWGILSRKSKPRRKSRRAPTPPPITIAPESDTESLEAYRGQMALAPDDLPSLEAGDDLSAPSVVVVAPSGSPAESLSSRKPPHSPSYSLPDEDTSMSMIDLDAALGPFNTPLPLNHEWEAAQAAGGMSKRQLHSAAGMSRFSGPGMHYSHRRAESAPVMQPFNRTGIPRFGSSTAMADVFEEDEEDEETDGKAVAKDSSSVLSVPTVQSAGTATSIAPALATSATALNGPKPSSVRSASSSPTGVRCQSSDGLQERTSNIDIRVTSSDGNATPSVIERSSGPFDVYEGDDATSSMTLSRRGSNLSGVSDDDRTQPSMCLKSEYSASSLHDEVIVEEEDGYANKGDLNKEFSFGSKDGEFSMESSSDSTIHSPGRLMKGKDLAPVDVSPMHLATNNSGSLAAPISPFSMGASPTSVFPQSPRSPMSYDTNRMSVATAPSSYNDDNNFRALLQYGEPGPEVRISSDIPSLTSSNSNTTRDSGVAHALQGPPGPAFAAEIPGVQPRGYLPSRNAERPASFTSTMFNRRRSSLASINFSRLISTSHGERSKLSTEVPLDTASTASGGEHEKRKSGRGKRRWQFWRSKESC